MKKSTFLISIAIIAALIQVVDNHLIAPYVNTWQNCLIVFFIDCPSFYFVYWLRNTREHKGFRKSDSGPK
ncbi:hypothetical protein [Fructobacillus durionis]|uniref:Uncharacterized protein n=1 Tax=Fructobacillus durionis TaxID=283737 RepID=A0A1I1DYZ6_9LACO|nr:hypothetical protein [Fructobacillus durionis]SFB80279.1 hypothetical protein SAMN05660453_0216 [Fructobacillus durionis]